MASSTPQNRDEWIDADAQPNGIGPICRHCHRLIDWHPYDHADGCPEHVSDDWRLTMFDVARPRVIPADPPPPADDLDAFVRERATESADEALQYVNAELRAQVARLTAALAALVDDCELDGAITAPVMIPPRLAIWNEARSALAGQTDTSEET